MRVLLDTNIRLRSVEPLHAQHQVSTNAVSILRKNGHDLVLVPQVLYEFWSVATRPAENNGLGMSTSEARHDIAAVKRLLRLLLDERAVYAEWEKLMTTLEVKGKKTHDARLVAAMRRHNITHILSFNAQDFDRYPSISPLVPDQVGPTSA